MSEEKDNEKATYSDTDFYSQAEVSRIISAMFVPEVMEKKETLEAPNTPIKQQTNRLSGRGLLERAFIKINRGLTKYYLDEEEDLMQWFIGRLISPIGTPNHLKWLKSDTPGVFFLFLLNRAIIDWVRARKQGTSISLDGNSQGNDGSELGNSQSTSYWDYLYMSEPNPEFILIVKQKMQALEQVENLKKERLKKAAETDPLIDKYIELIHLEIPKSELVAMLGLDERQLESLKRRIRRIKSGPEANQDGEDI